MKLLKIVLAVSLLSIPVTFNSGSARAGEVVIGGGGGGGGRDNEKVLIGVALIAFIAILLGLNGGSLGGNDSANGDGAAAE